MGECAAWNRPRSGLTLNTKGVFASDWPFREENMREAVAGYVWTPYRSILRIKGETKFIAFHEAQIRVDEEAKTLVLLRRCATVNWKKLLRSPLEETSLVGGYWVIIGSERMARTPKTTQRGLSVRLHKFKLLQERFS